MRPYYMSLNILGNVAPDCPGFYLRIEHQNVYFLLGWEVHAHYTYHDRQGQLQYCLK